MPIVRMIAGIAHKNSEFIIAPPKKHCIKYMLSMSKREEISDISDLIGTLSA